MLVAGLMLVALSLLMLLRAVGLVDLGWVPGDRAVLTLMVGLTVGVIGWVLVGLVVEAGTLPELYRRPFSIEESLGMLWIALGVAGAALAALAWGLAWLTDPVSPELSRAWLALLATGAAGIFVVAPLAVPVLWAVERWAPPPLTRALLPVLVASWTAGAIVLFAWLLGG